MTQKIPDLTGRSRDIATMLKDLEGSQQVSPLRQGGGGPYDTGMEQRISQLENRAEKVEGRLISLGERLAKIEVKLDFMPTKDWVHLRMWAVALAVIASVGLMIRFLPAAS